MTAPDAESVLKLRDAQHLAAVWGTRAHGVIFSRSCRPHERRDNREQ
jgi:hypothetical protein